VTAVARVATAKQQVEGSVQTVDIGSDDDSDEDEASDMPDEQLFDLDELEADDSADVASDNTSEDDND
jgi:hypothetical protein